MASSSQGQQYGRISEVVERFGLSAEWWRQRADAGDVEVQRINNQRIFNLRSCESLLKEGKPVKKYGSKPVQKLVHNVHRHWRDGL